MAIATSSTTDFDVARRAMIDSQLRTSGVNEPWVLARFGDRGMLAAPLFHARLLAEAKPVAADRVLVVDGGSGYLPALLEGLAASITVVSPADALMTARAGDFTLLLIDGAVEQIPATLVKRLAGDARVATGMVTDGVTRLAVGRKAGEVISLLPLAEMGIPRLPAFDKPKAWSF